MERYLKLIACMALSFICVSVFAGNDSKMNAVALNDSVVLKINSPKNKNENFEIGYPYLETKTKLDSTGEGKVTLPVEKGLFIQVGLNNSEKTTLFIEPGNDLSLTVRNDNILFSGKGADPNNYLIKANILMNQLRDSIKIVINDDSPERFMNVCKTFEIKFESFHKKWKDSLSFSKNVSYLLHNDLYALFLTEKQKYLSYFSKAEIDSLHLENKLDLLNNKLYQDTLLIKAHSDNLESFLFLHYNYENKKISNDEIEKGLYPLASARIIRSQYSKPIQEFLLINDLGICIQLFGHTKTVDSMFVKLKEMYPSSSYLPILVKRYKEFEYLSPGNDAPDFKGIAADGKSYALKGFIGKVVLIDTWATWCKPCIKSLPSISALQQTFKNEEIVFLFISIDADESKWKDFLNQHPELKGINLRMDKEDFLEAYKIAAIPRYILIDKKGKLVNAFIGHPIEKIKPILSDLLK